MPKFDNDTHARIKADELTSSKGIEQACKQAHEEFKFMLKKDYYKISTVQLWSKIVDILEKKQQQ